MKKIPLYNEEWQLIGEYNVEELTMLSSGIREEIKQTIDDVVKVTINLSKGRIDRERVEYKNGWTKNNFIFS